MEIKKINCEILKKLVSHTRKLDFKNKFLLTSLKYERCGELPYIIEILSSDFSKNYNYLDIGTGNSMLPTYLLNNSNWNINCIDKFKWVHSQKKYFDSVCAQENLQRLKVFEHDFLQAPLKENFYDVITNISVIEHFEGNLDSKAMEYSAKMLKKDGIYILTAPFNENNYKEFYVKSGVYGENYSGAPVFFQRHYDTKNFYERIIKPSGLKEISRIYMADYGFQFKEKLIDLPLFLKPLRCLYHYFIPEFAKIFITYRDIPFSNSEMKMNTASSIIIVLKKE